MVIEGEARGRPIPLAQHLMRTDTNERVNVLDIWGIDAPDVYTALREMHAIGAGARSKRTLYHANIDPRADEQLTDEQKLIAVQRLAEKMGFENQPRVVVEHVKEGRHHMHVVFGRIDLETMTAIPDSHNFRKHEELATDLSREFGHAPVRRALTRDKAKEPRPEPAPTYTEYLIAERSGRSPQEAKRLITESWQQTKTGREFVEHLAAAGFTLARGDRKDYVLIDQAGDIHGLTGRRVMGVKAAEIRERMADVDASSLPDVAEAKRLQFLRQQQQDREAELQTGFVSAIERQREEEKDEKPRAGGQPFANEAAAALHALNKTSGADLENVIVAADRRNADTTWQQLLRKTESIEERMNRDADQAREAALARSIDAEKTPIVTPEPQPAAPQKRGVLQRLMGWLHRDEAPSIEETARTRAQEITAQATPETIQRPSAWLFVRIFGALIDAYQHALDRARAETALRQIEHKPDVTQQQEKPSPPPAPPVVEKPAAKPRHESLADQIKREREELAGSDKTQERDEEARQAREERAAAARRLREQEERERTLDDDDPRY